LKSLDDKANSASQEVVKSNVAQKHAEEAVKQEESREAGIRETIKETTQAIAEKRAEVEISEKSLALLRKKHAAADAEMKELQRQFETLGLGLSVGGSNGAQGKGSSISDHILETRKALSLAKSEQQQFALQIKNAEKELKVKQTALEKMGGEVRLAIDQLHNKEGEVEKLRRELSSVGFDDKSLRNLLEERKDAQKEVERLSNRKNGLESQLTQLRFDYDMPPGVKFSSEKVLGTVASLIKVKDPNSAAALQVAAGSRLYNVVVEDDETGKTLLKHGGLKRRVTIIPLKQIVNSTVNPKVIRAAEDEVGPENVHVALSLVGFAPNLQAAMNYVFGGTFVCKDIESAQRVTFNPSVKTRSVSLSGDLFDPSGTLTGGSEPGGEVVLAKVSELNDVVDELKAQEKKLASISKRIEELQEAGGRVSSLRDKLEISEHELLLLREKNQKSEQSKLSDSVSSLKTKISQLQEETQRAAEQESSAAAKLTQLEDELAGKGEDVEKKLKRIEATMAKNQGALQESSLSFKKAEAEHERLTLELASLEQELSTLQGQLEEAIRDVNLARDRLDSASMALSDKQRIYERIKRELDEKRASLQSQNSFIKDLVKVLNSLASEISSLSVEIKKLDNKYSRSIKSKEDSAAIVKSLVEQNKWINQEKEYRKTKFFHIYSFIILFN